MSEGPPAYSNVSVGQEDPSSPMIRDRDFKVLSYPNLEAISGTDFNADPLNLFVAFDQKRNKLSIEDRAFPLLRPSTPTVPPVIPTNPNSDSTIQIQDFEDLNYPNELEVISDADFNADGLNLFIAFDERRSELCLERRAFPLLRPSTPTVRSPRPGLISFIGETGNGKSWILRSLKRGEDRGRYPPPLVAPGRQPNNSTSADVHLYADSASSESANPILFLDFEGLKGSTLPSALEASSGTVTAISNSIESPRYSFVQDAYPRIAYAFSNCIILVSKELKQAEYAAKLLLEYSNGRDKGLRHLGFKPALFVVFNKIASRDLPPSSWSVEDSTKTFFENEGTKALLEHYHKIFVIKIPQLTQESSDLVINQLDELGRLLREQHSEACNRRVAFRLDFTADQVTAYLTRALRVFTNRNNAVFDWQEQFQHELPSLTNIAEDLWIHFYQLSRDTPILSPVRTFQDALEKFHSHVGFCVRLHLARHPPVGRTVGFIPRVIEDTIDAIDQVTSRHVPCGGVNDSLECDRVRQTHDNDFHTCGAKRWRGTFEHAVQDYLLKNKISKFLEAHRSQGPKLSIKDSESFPILSKIRSVYSCVGCLNYPSTFLSCGHGFCEECVEDIARTKDLHRLVTIECPICQHTLEGQYFSPRFLPPAAGYRILSLEGGGFRGMAQILILQAIERRCCGIPIVHLFDFFIGTSIGGQLVLALASRDPPLTLSNAATELVAEKFMTKKSLKTSIWHLFKYAVLGSTMYSTSALEASLKDYFGESPHLLSVRTPPSPHVAVAAVSHTKSEKRVIPNYMRPPSGDLDEDKRRLVLSTKPEQCMPTWIAARCTAATHPYFKEFKWNGECLLDEGCVASVPAELGVDETRCLWPDRRMDTLVSVGTGLTQGKMAEVGTRVVTNPETLWTDFIRQRKSEMARIFRLQPVFGETFPFDTVEKLDMISNEVDTWLKNNGDQINLVSNQLIASLFFFKPSTLDSQRRTQSGSIECRLPPDLLERQAMVNALLHLAHARQLFTFDIPGRGRTEHIERAIGFLQDLLPGAELSIPVTIDNLPLVGGSTIDIKLCDMFSNGESRYSISGCPFVIRE